MIGERAVADLPLNGRDPLQLAVTAPGVLPGQKSANGVPPGEDFIGAGTREIQNSVSLDGISIMNNLITTTPYHPSVDAIQEFEVQTGTYSAQYGAYLGAHLNLISKSGSNQLHGRRSSSSETTSSMRGIILRSRIHRRRRYGRTNSVLSSAVPYLFRILVRWPEQDVFHGRLRRPTFD